MTREQIARARQVFMSISPKGREIAKRSIRASLKTAKGSNRAISIIGLALLADVEREKSEMTPLGVKS
jgi:hypothetical protein